MDERLEVKKIAKGLAWLIALVGACAVTRGWALLPVVIIGLWCAVTGKRGLSLLAFAYLPLLTCLNPIMVPTEGIAPTIARCAFILMCIIMAIAASSYKGNCQIPLGGLLAYLLVAFISSMNGWFPTISYWKIINFLCFILGIWFGTRNLYRDSKDLDLLHIGFFVMVIFLSFGSIAVWPFPTIAYQQNLILVLMEGSEYATETIREALANDLLFVFSGVTYNSQCLGPLLACCFVWILCDMLFVAHKFTKIHLATLVAILLPLYLTRSRTALFAVGVGIVVVLLMTMHRMNLRGRIRARVQSALTVLVILGIAGALTMEIRDKTISKWLRKTNDVETDRRTLNEALTASREFLNEQNWYDFHKNPLLGMGFQVMEFHREDTVAKHLCFRLQLKRGCYP